MPSHLSTIGFPVDNQDSLLNLATYAARRAVPVPVAHGYYYHWSDGSGAELWLQADTKKTMLGMVPHFWGPSRQNIGLVERLTLPDSSPLDGAFRAWVGGPADDPEVGDYPIIFAAPDSQTHVDLSLPCRATAQIAAFAHEVKVFASEEAWYTAQAPGQRFAAQSFFPLGDFPGDEAPLRQAHALFTGHITAAAQRENGLTGEPFWWAAVATLSATYDVVIDPDLLTTPLSPGQILSGLFWLSGRLLPGNKNEPA